MKRVLKAIRNPLSIISYLGQKGFLNWIKDERYLHLMYRAQLNKPLNLLAPKTFNEKLQWLKLYDRNPFYTQLVDKYEARKYIAKTIGGEYLIPLFGVWGRFEDINISELPNRFVMKCTHDSGGIIKCLDRSNFDLKNSGSIMKQRL